MKSLLLLVAAAAAPLLAAAVPDIETSVNWGADNALAHVYNGQQNNVAVSVANPGEEPFTVDAISGSFKQYDGAQRTLKNTSAIPYKLEIPAKTSKPYTLPFAFHSEFKPGSLNFLVYVDYHDADGNSYRATAYDGIVIIAEPPSSWFDLQLLSIYIIILGIASAAVYVAYVVYFPPKKSRSSEKSKARANDTAAAAPSDPMEWIPEHHLRPRKKKDTNTSASGTELDSGAESSASARKAKGKGRRR